MTARILSWLRLLALLPLVTDQSQASLDWMPPPNECTSTHGPKPVTGPSPPLPQLPHQYSMKVEANIIHKGWTTEVEEHYDSINKRASVSLSFNGTTTISIFNFNDSERYDIYPNGTCTARASAIDYLGLASMGKQNRTVLATVNEVFRFGMRYSYHYVGRESVRGIPVHHWTSCQEWPQLAAKFQLDYYFSMPDYTTAGGYAQIPIRAVLNGSAHNVGMFSQRINGSHIFQHIYEFVSFREGPPLNADVFQVPAGTVCSGRQNGKPLPTLPDTFEMSMETVVPGAGKHPLQQYVRYDHAHGLVDTHYVASVPLRNDHLITTSASTVEDFRNGLIYAMDLLNQSCVVSPMPASRTKIGMVHGQNLYLLASSGTDQASNTFSYQGQTKFRGMLVDAWAAESDDLTFEVFFLPQRFLVTYPTLVGMLIKNRTTVPEDELPRIIRESFPPDVVQWPDGHPLPADVAPSGLPETGDQPSWGPELERILDRLLTEKIYNVFNYQPMLSHSLNFQTSLCYHNDQISRIKLLVTADYDNSVRNNFAGFSNSLRDALAKKMGASVLQISELIPAPNGPVVTVMFTLLGAAPVKGVQQKDISELKNSLEKAIHNGIAFTVHYPTHSKDFMVNKSVYLIDDTMFPLNLTNTPMDRGADSNNGQSDKSVSDREKGKGGTTYSASAVAGIAFATLVLGAVICFGVLFFLYRRRLPSQQSIPYQLTS